MTPTKHDITLVIAHALMTGLYNDAINGLDVDTAEGLDKFLNMGRKIGMASAAISEGLHEWLEEQETNANTTEDIQQGADAHASNSDQSTGGEGIEHR